MDPVIVPLQSRRRQRALLFQKFNHAVPAAGLVTVGAQALANGAGGFDFALAVVEIATSLALVAMLLHAARAVRRGDPPAAGHGRIDWVDIWAAAVLFVEAAERWHLTHHLARPTLLTACLTLAMGLFHGRLASAGRRRRSLRLSDHELYVGGRPFQAFRVAWPDITAIVLTERSAEIRTKSGRKRLIDLADLDNGSAVRAALQLARSRVEPARAPARADGLAGRGADIAEQR